MSKGALNFIVLVSIVITALVSTASAQKSSVCSLTPSVTGNCRAFIPSFTYNSQTNSCNKFTYGGCGGNKNRFGSLGECERKCKTGQTKVTPKSTKSRTMSK